MAGNPRHKLPADAGRSVRDELATSMASQRGHAAAYVGPSADTDRAAVSAIDSRRHGAQSPAPRGGSNAPTASDAEASPDFSSAVDRAQFLVDQLRGRLKGAGSAVIDALDGLDEQITIIRNAGGQEDGSSTSSEGGPPWPPSAA
jgi:hypothetical protein